MRAYYFKISGKALIEMFRVSGMILAEDARIVKTGATGSLNNDFWVMVASETEGSEFKEGMMAEERTPKFRRDGKPDVRLACARLRWAAEDAVAATKEFNLALEGIKRRIE